MRHSAAAFSSPTPARSAARRSPRVLCAHPVAWTMLTRLKNCRIQPGGNLGAGLSARKTDSAKKVGTGEDTGRCRRKTSSGSSALFGACISAGMHSRMGAVRERGWRPRRGPRTPPAREGFVAVAGQLLPGAHGRAGPSFVRFCGRVVLEYICSCSTVGFVRMQSPLPPAVAAGRARTAVWLS